MTAIRGPAMHKSGPLADDIRAGTSFRILSAYEPGTDTFSTRLDVKVDGEQYNVSFAMIPAVGIPGASLRDPRVPLLIPIKGVEGTGGTVDRATLKQALLDLAEVL